MARIRWVNESEATGAIGRFYSEWMAANPGRPEVPGIYKCLSLRPDLLSGMDEISDRVLFAEGHLTRRVKEMIATYVSALNQTPYCIGSHAYFLQLQDGRPDLHASLARADLDAAPVSVAERALLDFARRVTEHADRTTDTDVEALRALGWTDPQIAECVYVTALFAFFNRVANAFGLADPHYFDNPPPRGGEPLIKNN